MSTVTMTATTTATVLNAFEDPKYTSNATVGPVDVKKMIMALEDVHKREKLIQVRSEIEKKLNSDVKTVVVPKPNDNILTESPFVACSHVTKRNKNYHYIHGKAYDLRPFMKQHPGGEGILKMTQGLIDATPNFESYHAFANRPSIMKQLEGYRVIDSEEDEKAHENDHGMYSFEENGFYRTLTRRVRAYFDAKSNGGVVGTDAEIDKKSLTKGIKANWLWATKVTIQLILSLIFFIYAFFVPIRQNQTSGSDYAKSATTAAATGVEIEFYQAIICAFLAGNFFIQWGFTAMHDASHFAIASRNHWINEFTCRVWCACSLWVCRVWMLHHAVLHHSFTGASNLDPDLYHMMPVVRKHPDVPRSLAIQLFRKLGEWFGMAGWAVAAISLYVFAPGMWFGQVMAYFTYSSQIPILKEMWGMKYPEHDAYAMKWFEYLLVAAHIGSHLYRANIFISYALIVSLNLSYCICIVADHDTADAALTNHVDVDSVDLFGANGVKSPNEPENESIIEGNTGESSTAISMAEQYKGNYGKVDWGEAQVRNSSNFCNHWANDLFAMLHGGINYQIEHHLFPGMSHVHYHKIAPIVRQTCDEFNIPYAAYPSLKTAWYSFLVTVRSCMSEEDEAKMFVVTNNATKEE